MQRWTQQSTESSNYLLAGTSRVHLAEIATSIIKWREISPFLGLTEAEEHEILGAIPPLSVLEQKIAMLRLWKKKKGKAATYNRLCRAFRKSNQLDLEEEMKEILAESEDSLDLVDVNENEGGELILSLTLQSKATRFSGIRRALHRC